MSDKLTFRIRLITVPIFLFAIIIVIKLYLVQVVNGETYSARADRQYARPYTSLFDRGSIFFTAKDGSLIAAAGLKNGYMVSINPTKITDREAVYSGLSKYISGIDYTDFMAKSSKAKDPFEEVADRVESDVAKSIEKLDIPGVDIYKERWRYYPGGNTGSHMVGFLSYKGDKLGAYYGLESYYDEVLSRTTENTYANFFTELLHGIKDNVLNKKSLEGDIVLSVEPTVQGYLEDVIESTNTRWSSSQTGGIVMDPNTGEIYAMALTPSFDPNNTREVEDLETFSNNMVESVYEMGSIIKPLTVAAGLDAGVITPGSTYNDKGFATFDKATIYNFDRKAYGTIDMQTALSKSLNVGMAHIVERIGRDRFTDYMKSFGITEKTGIDLPYEGSPLTDNLDTGRMIEPVTASFGQGIALTPISTLSALSALANGGYRVHPHLAKSINYKIGVTKQTELGDKVQIIKPETSEEITRMLVNVVDEALLGGEIKHDHYAIAAKTGTAQIPSPQGGYYDDRYLHSFFGYFPAYKPRFIVFLYTVYPKGVDYASHTLTSPFNNMTDFLISYYNIPPDR